MKRSNNIGNGFNLLTTALAEVPKEAWEVRPEPNEWSVHEIVVHMADSELMSALRVRKLIVEPGSTLMGYEEAKWADTLNYKNQSVDDALQIIKLARQTTYHLLKTLPDEVFTHSVIDIPKSRNRIPLRGWLNIYARHIPDHIEQIRKTVATVKKQK